MKDDTYKLTTFYYAMVGGEIFAAACHDAILILKVVESGKTLERLGTFEGHSTAVTAFDWSTDDGSGKMYLQSSSVSHEYLCCKLLLTK